MKILVYNKYMPTMGGGEKHIGAVIEYLSKNNDVTILSDKKFDIDLFKSRLNIDLTRAKIIIKKTDDNFVVSKESYNYDLFINSTYQSTAIGCAKKNIYFNFFPINIHSKINIRYKFLFRRFVENFFLAGYKFISPIHPLESYNGKLGNWVDPDMFILLNHKLGIRELRFTYINLNNSKLEKRIKSIELNNNPINFSIKNNVLAVNIPKSTSSKDLLLVIKISGIKEKGVSKFRGINNFGIFLTDVSVDYDRRLYKMVGGYLKESLSRINMVDFIYRKYGILNIIDFVNTYDSFISNSNYTKYYTERILGVKSRVLFPPIDTDIFYSSENKKDYIISVGRFFFGSHNKKHLEMIRFFKKMYDSNRILFSEWEYHLCGGLEGGHLNKMYFERIKDECVGYPIFIHENIKLNELIKLYSESKIFWHASGYMENENLSPERFEHFGITTVEAMSSGCVPIVINKAGQKEIIENRKDGILWETCDDLIRNTVMLAQNESKRRKISKKAIEKSKVFSRENFNDKVNLLIEKG